VCYLKRRGDKVEAKSGAEKEKESTRVLTGYAIRDEAGGGFET
jgi:hypothetical protein